LTKKKNLDDYYDKLFADNWGFIAKYPKKKIKWKILGEYVFMYAKRSVK
jgi:hypothetical protein